MLPVAAPAAAAGEPSVTAAAPAAAPDAGSPGARTGWLRVAAVRLDSTVVAARAHVERGRVERAAQAATPGRETAPAPEPAAPDPHDDARGFAEHVLRSLPGGDEVEIAWDHPMIGNHLGGVRLDDPTVMMLNSRRFEAEPERIASTVMHEIGHFYQGAAITSRASAAGGWWAAYWELDAALRPVFGKKWMERSADCVALHLGATWTHYTSDCSDSGAVAAVEELVARSIL